MRLIVKRDVNVNHRAFGQHFPAIGKLIALPHRAAQLELGLLRLWSLAHPLLLATFLHRVGSTCDLVGKLGVASALLLD